MIFLHCLGILFEKDYFFWMLQGILHRPADPVTPIQPAGTQQPPPLMGSGPNNQGPSGPFQSGPGPAPEMRGPPDMRGPSDMRGPPDMRGPGDMRGPPDMRGPGDMRGPPDMRGPQDMRGPGRGFICSIINSYSMSTH